MATEASIPTNSDQVTARLNVLQAPPEAMLSAIRGTFEDAAPWLIDIVVPRWRTELVKAAGLAQVAKLIDEIKNDNDPRDQLLRASPYLWELAVLSTIFQWQRDLSDRIEKEFVRFDNDSTASAVSSQDKDLPVSADETERLARETATRQEVASEMSEAMSSYWSGWTKSAGM